MSANESQHLYARKVFRNSTGITGSNVSDFTVLYYVFSASSGIVKSGRNSTECQKDSGLRTWDEIFPPDGLALTSYTSSVVFVICG